MAWELIESNTGKITDEEIICLYQLLSCSSYRIHLGLAEKIQPVLEIAKHEQGNGHKQWENEGGSCPPCNNNGH